MVVLVVPVVVVEVVPDVDVAVVAVVAVPEVSLIVLAGIVEVEVVELVSVAIVPLVVVAVSVAVDIVEDVSVAAALVSVLLAAVSLLQAKPNTLRARTVRRTRSFLLICFFPLVVGWLSFVRGLNLMKRVPAHPPWQLIEIPAKRLLRNLGLKTSSTRFATSMPAGCRHQSKMKTLTVENRGDERSPLGEGL